ncbi:LysM peptidoglycan-binding domain-containing protein [Mesorhizobium temperatum]|uniref:LysM domain-containing protein n=1 Tax=Mesorhizobium temperatum TaxID=241416 RepID=A0A271LRX2_9HYPH|nr:LysM peptidoglycan-binding domain-containing protein [Mesorhizobium temperatum]PAQ10922.1 hypothetical protein CIT26_06345 [Mesorhizobium temperatum]
MVRPITPAKPPVQPQKVNASAKAEQVSRLEAQAAKLREQIKLANRMGERDWAAQARQDLAQVNTQLTTAQPTAATARPAPELPAAVTAANGNGGTTAAPALFTTQNFGGTPNLLLTSGEPDGGDVSPEAKDILKAIEGGKSIDNIAAERKMSPEKVVAALNAGKMTAIATEHANGDTRTVVITDGSGRTITENQDYQHGGYYTEVTGRDGQATSSPIRDDLGRKETTSVDAQTGAITTTFVDDLGDGSVTERTTNPQTRITTTTETSGDGAVTVTKNLPNGSTVETVTPAGGPALPVTTVTGPGGEETVLAHSQAADGSGAPSIQEQLAEGKSIEEIAEESNLTPEQVIAELNAAGLEVTQGGDEGETLQIVVTDPETGKTVTYNNDYQHGSRSVTTVDGNTETTDSVDGNGRTSHTERNTETGEQTTTIVDPKNNTETTIVFDKDGRRTETIVETLNDGEPIDYEVQPGDNLTEIAEAHGVTLEELAESNPELFTSPRDPDLIHPGETVVIEGATKTTVKVTFNGYTLTTSPDGKITLTNDTTGAVTDIAAGTAQQALAELLLSINPNSSDPEQAKEDLVVKTTLDGIFGGATPELTTEALEKQQAVVDAMALYGPGQDATGATLDGGPTSVGPYGNPPSATAPSGGKWVPLLVDGSWKWFDPEVAKAIAAENVAIANFGEAEAKAAQSAAQLDVYALDAEYKNAMEGAESTLDEVLAPYGLEWKPPEPKGTLADAQNRLTLANNALESASTARAEYEQGQTSLLEAIDKQVDLPTLSDPNQTAVSSPGGPSAEETNQQGKAAHAEVAELFTNVSLHTANGNKATIDQMISSTELELKLTDAKPGSPEYTAIEERLEGLQTLQGAAANQVTLAEAYQEYGVAQKEAADLAVTMEPLKQQLLAQAQERNPHHFDWEGYTNGHGDFTGKIKSQDIVEENGQLYVVTVYEHATFTDENGDDTNIHKSALTYDLNDEGIREDFRNDPLNKQWQEMMASTQDTSSASVCTANGTGSQSALDAAKSKIVGVQVDQLDAGLRDAKTGLVDATAARDQAITDYGPGTVEAPAGTLKPGETAVKITVNDRALWVAPEVAAAFEEQGPGAIGDSGKWVQIEMDGQKLWVHPEVAAAEIDRGQAETEKNQLEDWEENVRPAMVAGRDWYAFSASHPKLLEYGSAEHEAKLKYEYFEEHKDQALAGYQVQFENLYEAGFTGEYETYTPDQLSTAVGQTLGPDASSEDVQKVTEEITDRAGDDAEVKIVPIFSLDGGKESTTALFAIKSGGDEIGYVDSSGKYYSTFDEFQHENRIFSEKGNLVMAKGGDMSLGKGGFSLDELEVADARKVGFWDKATDIGLGIVAGVSTIVSFVPGGQWAIPIAIGSGSVLGGKALIKEGDHFLQGGDFDSQSGWNIATGVTAFLPVGAGALRTFGLAKTSLSRSQAFAGGFGMTRMKDASWGIGRFQVNVEEASYAGKVSEFMQSGNRLTTAAWSLDAGAVVTGVPLLGKSVEDLAAHGGEMSLLELANAVVGIGVGTVGTGLGGRSLLSNMPGTGGTRSGAFPDSGPQPRAVYEMGPDGVYRPTGEQVMPDPDEIIIDGDVVGETSGQQGPGFGARNGFDNTGGANRPTGPRALPAGESDGPNPPPPPGGKGDPSGDGQSSRPMVVHEAGPDGVYRPTDKLVFHDPSHPVVEGTVVNVHDEGPSAPGERGDPENASDRDAQGAREQNVRQPADSDPIVVPPVRGDGTTRPAESGLRLVWDPATKTFTGMPKPDAGEYTYTSGKDPQQTGYLDGARPSDPAVLATPDEVLLQSETETRDGSSRETTERQGPSGAKLPEGGAQGTRPLMRYTLGNRHTGEMLVDFNLPEGQRTVAIPEPKAITAAPEPVPAPVELDPSLPVLYLGADGRWTADPNARTEPPAVTDTGHPSPARPDGTPIINRFSSNPYSFGQTFNAVKAGLRRIGTRYLNTEPRYDYPKLGELVDSIYHRPVPQDGVTAGQDIYVEAGGKYLPAKVIVAGPQASMTRDIVLGEHATDAGYLGSGPTVERAKRGSITTPNGQLRVNTPAREVHTFDPAKNPEVSHRSALGETLTATLPALPDDAAATPAPTWTPEQVELVGDYLQSLERSSDPVVRDAVTMTRVQLGGRGLPQSGTEITQAQHNALGEMLNADQNSPFTGSKPVGQLSMNGLTTLQVFSAQGKLPHLSPGEVIDQLGLSTDARLPRGEQYLTAGALPGEAGWTNAGRGIVGDYLKAASGSTDPNLAAAANAASPFFKGGATKPGKAVTAAQQDALMQVLQADSGSTWVYGPKLQPETSFKPAGELSPEGRYNEKVLSGHDTWTPYLWREMRGYAANQQKSADSAVRSLAHALENALPASKPKAGTEINSEVPVLLERLLDADKASSWRAPTFFTDAQGVWRSDRATVSWFLQEHEANVVGGPILNDQATTAVGLGGSMFGIKMPLPSRQVYGELSLKNNGPGPGGTGFLLPVHPNDAKGQKLFVNGYRPNFAYDEAAAPSARWVASAPMLSKNTFQKENAVGVSLSLFGFSLSGAYVKRTLLYLGGEGGRPGYTRRESGPLSQRAASFWEEAARGGASHYSSEGKVPGFEDRVLYRNYNLIAPFGGGNEPWRGSPAFEGVPREAGAGPLNRLDRTDRGVGFAASLGSWPVTTVELGTVRKDLVPHTRSARAHPGSSEGAQKVFSALEASDGRLTPDVLEHLDTYLAEVAASPHGDLRFAGQRVADVFPELGMAPYPDQLATTGGRPDGMGRPAWKALRQQLDQQARSELTPTQAHYLNRLLEQDVQHNSPPPDTAPAPAGDGPIVPRSPAPRREQGPAAEGSWGPSTAKPLTQAEIAANRQEASSMLDDMLQQDLGMPEMRADLADQVSRSPEMMGLLRNAHAKGVRIVNPARRDLRIFDPSLEQDLTATGSGLDRRLDVISVDADMFRTPDADNDAVVAGFVDALSHELSHVTDAPIDVLPQDFANRQAHRDATVDARLKSEGEAALVQYIVADELAANGGKPNLALQADQAQADIFDRFTAGEIDRTQAVHEMAALYRSMEPSIADGGTYADYYGHFADAAYQAANVAPGHEGDVASNASHVVGEPRAAAPANKGQPAPNNGPLTRDGVRATPLDQVPDLVMGDFQPTQIPWLKREQVAVLTEQQFRDMDQAGLLPYLTKSQLRGIPKAKIGQVNIAGLVGKQVPWLTEGHIRNVTDQQFRDFGKTGLTPHLTKPQLQAIKGDMVELVNMSKLEARQVPWFKPTQVTKFTSQQFKDLGEAGLLKNLTERQVPAISETMIDSVDVAKLDPKQVPWLTEKQIPLLTRDQWGAFTIHHTEAVTQPQVEAVTPRQYGEMSPGQFRKFTLEQFGWMSGDQTNALSVLQLTTFRATHKNSMTPDQRTLVEGALVYSRTKEYQAALDTFGTMAGTSYMLWSSLPPTWTATAGAVAFGVRGVVFGAQALFPNATASHKPFGRFLNALGGATFIAAAPGAATGMIQGKDLIVNSTFTVGNIVYGTKSMLQSFTGRPVIRNLAEYLAGPGYVLGCAAYTVQSWPSPIATVAGTMFTFGCAEFYASARRTDRMNSRSVPRTDADIAAAEKSDKKWAAWDRWTLGVTFGVGMLLFSLDALLAEPWESPKTPPPPDPKKPDGDASSQQPDDPSDVPDGPQIPTEDFPQLVVIADDGLNLRTQPDEDSTVVTVLQPGTFIEQTAKPSTDQSGQNWIPVEGFGPDGDMHSGWVSGDHVEVHPDGSSNPEGRTNPTLEKDGYQWVEVQNGDSIRLIAKTHSADVAETVVLNMDHILSPDVIFSGDRIYLPTALVG